VVAVADVPAHAATRQFPDHLADQKWLVADHRAVLNKHHAIRALQPAVAHRRAGLRLLDAILVAVLLVADQLAEPKWLHAIRARVHQHLVADAKLRRRSAEASLFWDF